MTVNARAIALQGVGFAAALLAVQGFGLVDVQQQATPGYSAAMVDVRYQAAGEDGTRRATKVAALLRAWDDQTYQAQSAPAVYRAASEGKPAAAATGETRVAALEKTRTASSTTINRTARSSRT